MELEELNELINLNELDLLYKIIEIASYNKRDAEKILKGEKIAGVRVRNSLQDIRLLCEIIRDRIQARKGIKWSEGRTFTLDKAIKLAQNKLLKDKEVIEKRKKERLARLLAGRR